MKITNPRIKENITIEDKVKTIKAIANAHFQEDVDVDGNTVVEFTPYYRGIALVIAVAQFCLEGIEFDSDESIYASITNNAEIKTLIEEFTQTSEFDFIMDNVEKIVEYKKSENIARIQNESNMILHYKLSGLIDKEDEKVEKEIEATENLNEWIEEQRKLNSLITPEMQKEFAEKFDPAVLTNSIIEKYSEGELHNRNKEVVKYSRQLREKDNKIIELENRIKKIEQRDKVKNVMSD